jgi:hypothetical protein
MLIVTFAFIVMPNADVVMLNVFMPSVVAPNTSSFFEHHCTREICNSQYR